MIPPPEATRIDTPPYIQRLIDEEFTATTRGGNQIAFDRQYQWASQSTIPRVYKGTYYLEETEAIASTGQPTLDALLLQLWPFWKKVESFQNLQPGWDSYEAEAPNEIAIDNAQNALLGCLFLDLIPSAVGPSPDGGVMIEFRREGNYYLLDFYNDGSFVFLREDVHGNVRSTDESIEGLRTIFETIKGSETQVSA